MLHKLTTLHIHGEPLTLIPNSIDLPVPSKPKLGFSFVHSGDFLALGLQPNPIFLEKTWAGFSSAKLEQHLLFYGRRRPSGDSQVGLTSVILEDNEREEEGY